MSYTHPYILLEEHTATAGTFRNKRCPPLADLVAAYALTDAYHFLHPNVQYSPSLSFEESRRDPAWTEPTFPPS